jgi:hypothetical protein
MTSHGQHLTESEFVDLFDGTLAPLRRQHVESCAACAAQAGDLATSAEGVRQADVPEPPPFFWAQFSARVSEAVSNEAARPRIGRFSWALALSEAAPSRRARASWLAAAAGIAVVVLAVVSLRNSPEDASVAAPAAVTRTAGADAGADALADDAVDFESDEAWALVQALAEDLDDEQMNDEGVSAGSGAAERMTLQLTEAERVELARLLQEQLRLAGVSESAS